MSPIRIGGIEKFSIVDFPNKMASVVFMQGCPWKCPFCHNVQLQDVNAETNIVWHKFIDFLNTRKGILDAVVFSGGEPLVQKGLIDAIKDVKALRFEVGLHTGGYRPEFFSEVIEFVDWVGFDIKAPLEEDRYKIVTGGVGDVEKVKESLNILIESGKSFECRTTCDPRFLDIEDLYKIADTLKGLGVKEYYLQKYRKVESDVNASEEKSLSLVENDELNQYLSDCFEVFDVRK
ncbi:MAG: anaerobic ribonucleoside-triphosphate reductase activating protein [Alphaproteobacteria bacterium]|nr:anaerobic ribonucleoside-triphosphate reductase activating protein [Alphaproteobacteria bacterium]